MTRTAYLLMLCLMCLIVGCVPAHGYAIPDASLARSVQTPVPVASKPAAATPTIVASATAEPTATPSAIATSTAAVMPSATATPLPSPTASRTPAPTPTPPGPLIAIDPGHGGRDLGARHFDDEGHMDLTESEVNLTIALRLRDLLEASGYRVLLTRDDDYALNADREDINGNGEVDHVDEAQARVDMVNAAKADLLLSIHQNAFYDETGSPAVDVGGTVTFYCADRPFSDATLRLANLVQEELVHAYHALGHDVRDRGVEEGLVLHVPGEPGKHLILLGPKTDRIVRPCQVPGVLSETLFLTHEGEAALASDPEALEALAEAYARAIGRFFEGETDG